VSNPLVSAIGKTLKSWNAGMMQLRILMIVMVLLAGRGAALAQDSTDYSVEILSVTSAGGQASSTRFDLLAAIAESEPVGTASLCNSGYAASLGYLSRFGEGPVANLLFVKQEPGVPSHIELDWSGSAQSFDVFRHLSAATLVDPSHLLTTTTECTLIDTDPPVGQVVYYTVLPANP
jgi:hypothetical protein